MPVPKDRPCDIQELERRAYYGCPVEVLYYGEYQGRCYLIDVNSMFPHVMRTKRTPRELYAHGFGANEYLDRFRYLGGHTAATVLVNATTRTYPVRFSDGVYHANGRFWTVLCGPELADAAKRGEVLDMGRWASYKLSHQFTKYVDYWHPLKSDDSGKYGKLRSAMAKRMLISLHGKLAQRKEHWKKCTRCESDPHWGRWRESHPETEEMTWYRSIAGESEYLSHETESDFAFPAISAWIAAYAREYMRDIVQAAGERQVLYVVADGAIVTEAGLRAIQTSQVWGTSGLGGIEVRSFANKCKIETVGNYQIGDITRHAGYTSPGFMADRIARVDGVRQRLTDVMQTGPALGLIHYGRVRTAFVGSRRGITGKLGWTRAPMVIADSDEYRQRQEGELPLQHFRNVDMEREPEKLA